MQLFVLLKMVPDTVEELEIGEGGRNLDEDLLRFKLGDSDEHALEEAVLLKERYGGSITVVALDSPEIDDVLYTAQAKGADRVVKLEGEFFSSGSRAAARELAAYLQPKGGGGLASDTVILLRGQSIDDLEGEVGPYLAEVLGLPYLGVVTAVEQAADGLRVTKEFAGGLRGVFRVGMPVVLGLQSAERPPRYVPIAKVRAAMKLGGIESVLVDLEEPADGIAVERLYLPEVAERAEMIEGDGEEAVERLLEVLAGKHLI